MLRFWPQHGLQILSHVLQIYIAIQFSQTRKSPGISFRNKIRNVDPAFVGFEEKLFLYKTVDGKTDAYRLYCL